MMRKYGLEEAQAHVDQNTLLEPNNFIPSWVCDLVFVSFSYCCRKLEMKKRRKFQMR
jgi:hypothetical protein